MSDIIRNDNVETSQGVFEGDQIPLSQKIFSWLAYG